MRGAAPGGARARGVAFFFFRFSPALFETHAQLTQPCARAAAYSARQRANPTRNRGEREPRQAVQAADATSLQPRRARTDAEAAARQRRSHGCRRTEKRATRADRMRERLTRKYPLEAVERIEPFELRRNGDCDDAPALRDACRETRRAPRQQPEAAPLPTTAADSRTAGAASCRARRRRRTPGNRRQRSSRPRRRSQRTRDSPRTRSSVQHCLRAALWQSRRGVASNGFSDSLTASRKRENRRRHARRQRGTAIAVAISAAAKASGKASVNSRTAAPRARAHPARSARRTQARGPEPRPASATSKIVEAKRAGDERPSRRMTTAHPRHALETLRKRRATQADRAGEKERAGKRQRPDAAKPARRDELQDSARSLSRPT